MMIAAQKPASSVETVLCYVIRLRVVARLTGEDAGEDDSDDAPREGFHSAWENLEAATIFASRLNATYADEVQYRVETVAGSASSDIFGDVGVAIPGVAGTVVPRRR